MLLNFGQHMMESKKKDLYNFQVKIGGVFALPSRLMCII